MTDIQLISIVLILLSVLIINIGIFLYLKIILKRISQYLACIEHYTTLLWLNKKSKIEKRKGIIKYNELKETPRK